MAGDKLNVVPQTNFMNSLSGKAAGVTITSSGSGIGGSVKVLMRGNKSIQGNNQPLYVIDGIPLINNSREEVFSTFEGRNGGDGISNLNPGDIENMSILKGASAAALYGSAAANGVILITTKNGKTGVPKINFSSSFTADKVAFIPKLQFSYAQTSPGSEYSWGSAITNAQKIYQKIKYWTFFKQEILGSMQFHFHQEQKKCKPTFPIQIPLGREYWIIIAYPDIILIFMRQDAFSITS